MQRAPPNTSRENWVSGYLLWLSCLALGFINFNSGMALYRSERDPYAIAFVAFSYVDLVMLFFILGAGGGGASRRSPHQLATRPKIDVDADGM
jgi:hypothetical protein